MHNWVDLRRLRYFVAIVECGSVSEASRVLNIAQPALTHHLRQMEAGYGAALLTRSRKGVTMTPAGEILFTCGKKMLGLLNETDILLDELRAGNSSQSKIVRVSVISSLSSAITPRLISLANAAMPSTIIHISEKSVHESYDLVTDGKLDLAVTLGYKNWKPAELLVHEELFYVSASSSDGGRNRSSISFSELAQNKLILPSFDTSVLRPDLESLARKHGLALQVSLEIDGLNPRKEAVLAGLGATVLPIVSVASEIANGSLFIRSFEPRITRPVILKARSGMDPAIISKLKDILIGLLTEVTHR